MDRRGPLLTLAVGLTVTAAVFVISSAAVQGDNRPSAASLSAPRTTTPTTATRPATTRTTVAAAATSTAATVGVPARDAGTWAGTVDRGGTTMALVIGNGRAVAYLCDGRRAEAWLKGTAEGGLVAMTGPAGAAVTAEYGPGGVSGVLRVKGRARPFAIPAPTAPAGLYRVVSAGAVGGWVVLPGGRQVGVVTVAGTARPAPALDPVRLTAQVGGTKLVAAPVRP